MTNNQILESMRSQRENTLFVVAPKTVFQRWFQQQDDFHELPPIKNVTTIQEAQGIKPSKQDKIIRLHKFNYETLEYLKARQRL